MTRSVAYAEFHRWIEIRRWCRDEDRPFSVGIEGGDQALCAELGEAVANYLSDADSAAPGGWLFFGIDLVARVATKTGIDELAQVFPGISSRGYTPCSERRCGFLADVAKIGGAVFYLPEACDSLRQHPDLFVVGIQAHRAGGESVSGDLTIDIDRLGRDTAVRVIADSALEWALGRPKTDPPNVTPWKS